VVGRGSFGEVVRVRDRQTRAEYAVKRARQRYRGERDRQARLAEIVAVQALGLTLPHPHIVQHFGAWEDAACLYIQTELCVGGNFADWLDSHAPPPEPQLWQWLLDTLLVLVLSLLTLPQRLVPNVCCSRRRWLTYTNAV
jgi:serine/threonine protein kinase